MHASDNDSENNSGSNFWEPREYSYTVKRLENGNKLCSELSALLQERSEIERAYSANLRKFASRVDTLLKTGMEYGTCSNILSAIAKESQDNADLHNLIAGGLLDPVQSAIKFWQKDNFHKSTISSSVKEVKQLDSKFEAAQKTWYKNYKLVNRCKKEYFQACKAVRSQQVQVQNAKNEPCGTAEQIQKMEEKLSKALKEEKKAQVSYEQALDSLRDVTPRYVDDMTQVFNESQNLEKERIEFFKHQAMQLHSVLDISSKPNVPQIFADFKVSISRVDADADLKTWSRMHGVDMTANFPSFQEYNPEHGTFGGSKKKKHSGVAETNNRVTLSGVGPLTSSDPNTATSSSRCDQPSNGSTPEHDAATADEPPDVPAYLDLVDDGKPGVSVRALYDYNGVEADELSFLVGDVFEKLEEEDEQGWCKGRKSGRIGLYPANYVEAV